MELRLTRSNNTSLRTISRQLVVNTSLKPPFFLVFAIETSGRHSFLEMAHQTMNADAFLYRVRGNFF
jgi:hypothetical protein